VGDILKWANPLPQLDINGATVLFTLTTAADAETEDEYRQRVIDRRAFPPQGGAYADYRIWAKTVEGILHAYPYTGRTPGTVDVYIEADTDTALDDDGTPTIAQRDAVAAAIEQDSSGTANRRPVSSYVTVEPISRQPFDVRVTGLIASSPDAKDATKVVILEALDDFLRAREPFIEGISPLPRADRITQSAVAGVVDEAASTQGATVSSVAVLLAGSPIVEYTLDFGQKAKRGNVTWL
jgi:hypothetical protein